MNLNIIRIELKYYVSYPDYLNLSKKIVNDYEKRPT